ncbi:hypothetical protein [Curtobacterium sp. 20TX0008]|uniref:hypothetical protein n=1 Tax=Curtobacterium sp. 20TX0008 TaxID=3022018 RepID=UPI00232BF7D9|nr:hypothetical protein [Curtobacterium sp. 20TX0008]MDB6425780.1 hypothetical protein [Curtobacterium sp. 20TX0008]
MGRHSTIVPRASVRTGWLLTAAGLVASVALALTATGTTSAYTASISNTTNTANTVSIEMTQGPDASTVACRSTATATTTCSTDLYAGKDLRPGDTTRGTSTVIRNTGGVTASAFSLTPGTCIGTVSTSNSICSWLRVTVTWTTPTGTTTVVSGESAAALGGRTFPVSPAPAAGQGGTAVVSVALDPAAPNDSQAQSMSQSLVWTFTA